MLAVVVTFGYAAFLTGPAVIGFLVHPLGMHHAMAVPPCCAPASWLSLQVMPKSDSDLAGADQ